jgi:CheY-like chemotaxis protein
MADPLSVLVIDDDAAIRRLLSTLLVRAHAAVETAPDGQDALARLADRRFNVVILDLMMPTINGFEFLDRVSESMPELLKRIIVLTAASPQAIDSLNSEKRVWQVIRKPFDINSLLQSVENCAAQPGSPAAS